MCTMIGTFNEEVEERDFFKWQDCDRDRTLIGKYYNCIFDEKSGHLDITKPHKHQILDAYRVYAVGYIYNGLALKLTDRGWCSGCPEDYICEK